MSDKVQNEVRTPAYREIQKRLRNCRKHGQYEDVLKLSEQLIAEGSRTVELAHYYADALAHRGNPKKAVETLEPWAGQMPCFTVALYGELLLQRNRDDEAREQFEDLAARPDLSASALQRAVRYFVDSGLPERASALAGKHGVNADLTPRAASARVAAPTSLAAATPESIDDLRKQLQKAPKDPAVSRQLAQALSSEGQWGEALDLLERSLGSHLEDKELRVAYFAVCRAADQKPRAQAFVEEVTTDRPELGSLWAAFRRGFQDREKKRRPKVKGKSGARSKPKTEARRKRVERKSGRGKV